MTRSQRVWAATAIAAVCVVIVVVVTTYAASSQLAMDSKRWQDNTWLGYSLKLTADKRSNTLSFTFPGLQSPKDGIDFLDTIHSFTPALANASSLTVTYTMQTTGTPIFQYDPDPSNTCTNPAHVRFWISDNGWWINDANMQYKRWWSNPTSLELNGPGQFSMTVSLDPAQWSSVYGAFGNQDSTTLSYFNDTLQNTYNIGLSFGGGCYFGHGVYVTGGTATFILQEYRINL